MPFPRKTAVAVSVLSCAAAAVASDYGNLYAFGDSMSDNGTYTNLVSAGTNKFTTNSGGTANRAKVWVEDLAGRYGLTMTPGYANDAYRINSSYNFVATGGNDYAVGGARVAEMPGVSDIIIGFACSAGSTCTPTSTAIATKVVPVSKQIADYLAKNGGAAKSDALYTYWGGANDVFYQAGQVGTGAISTADAGTAVKTAGSTAAAQIASLRAAGAKSIVVLALPDIGLTPYGAGLSASGGNALLSSLSTDFNMSLSQGLAANRGGNIVYLDPRPLMADILARPSAYGITNTTTPACAASALGCVAPAATAGYFYADSVHPSAAVHQILSDWVYATLNAPTQFVPLATLPLGRSGAQWRAMDDRLRSFETSDGAAPTGFFVTGDYSPSQVDASGSSPSISGKGKSLTVGWDKAWDNVVGGVAVGVADTSFDLGNNAGRVDYTETILSAFGGVRFGDAFVDALASMGDFDYSTLRNAVGNANTGRTKARQWGMKIGGGYNFVWGDVTHGPVAAVSSEKVDVDAFTESGTAALSFGKQSRQSFRHRIGWQGVWKIETDWARLSPYLRVTREREYRDNAGTLMVSQVGSPIGFEVPTTGKKDGWGLVALGTTVQFKTMTVQIGYTSNFAQSGVRSQSASVGIGIPF